MVTPRLPSYAVDYSAGFRPVNDFCVFLSVWLPLVVRGLHQRISSGVYGRQNRSRSEQPPARRDLLGRYPARSPGAQHRRPDRHFPHARAEGCRAPGGAPEHRDRDSGQLAALRHHGRHQPIREHSFSCTITGILSCNASVPFPASSVEAGNSRFCLLNVGPLR